MHASLIFPHYRDGDFSARGYPVRFEECPALKKPGKKATAEAKGEYRKAVKTHNLSHQGLRVIQGLRDELDRPGEEKRRMIVAVDGSLCNRTILSNTLPGTEIVPEGCAIVFSCSRRRKARLSSRTVFSRDGKAQRLDLLADMQGSFWKRMAHHPVQRGARSLMAKGSGAPLPPSIRGCAAPVQDIGECEKELS